MTFFRRYRAALISLLIGLGSVIAYWGIGNYDFVSIDDPLYAKENPQVQGGLSLSGLYWALTTSHAANWHPLTWLSHMLDVQLFGMNPGAFHLVNLFFHIANSILLFLVLAKMTKGLWQSAFVAALFALHPLHVESVAWIAERKDVLSAFFWILTMGAYAFYVEKPGWKRYSLTLVFFILGLMSKPMVVTLPFVLLLLDFWPLRRFAPISKPQPHVSGGKDFPGKIQKKKRSPRASITSGSSDAEHIFCRKQAIALLREKIPFLLATIPSCIFTFISQQKGGAIDTESSLGTRIVNALISYIHYLEKMVWPRDLAMMYLYPDIFSQWEFFLSVLLLLLLTGVVILLRNRFPHLLVGWFWYLGTLIPVIGIVQVGVQSMADRYTYIPLIGIFIMSAWIVPWSSSIKMSSKAAVALIASIVILCCGTATFFQQRLWKNSTVLLEHALAVTKDNWFALVCLGKIWEGEKRIDDAMNLYSEAVRIAPGFYDPNYNIGKAYLKKKDINRAFFHLKKATRIDPDKAEGHYLLGTILAETNRLDEAMREFERALQIEPRMATAHYNIGTILLSRKELQESARHFQAALQIDPEYGEAHNNLGSTLLLLGKADEAIFHFNEALRIEPGESTATANLRDALKLKAYLKSKGS